MHEARQFLLRLPTHWVWRGLLALTLLLVQQGGLRHAMAHVLGDAHGSDPAHAHEVLCKQCLAQAGMGDAPPPTPTWLPSWLVAPDALVPWRQAAAPLAPQRPGFQSRAPPFV